MPKKIICGRGFEGIRLFLGEKIGVVLDFGSVIDGLEIAVFVHTVESGRVVLDVVDEENAV